MIRSLVVAGILALGATAVFAQGDVIAQRKALMKSVGGHSGEVGKMLRGEAAYDQAKVTAALNAFVDAAAKTPTLFPADSKTGGETAALPKIWETNADFVAKAAKWGEDSKAALASIKDADTLKANWPSVGRDCGACHNDYRAKQN